MAQLDRLLTALATHRGEAIRLAEGEPASLIRQGASQPLTKQPLTSALLLSLVREVASADIAIRLDANLPFEFSHVTGDGAFDVRGVTEQGRWTVRIVPASAELVAASASVASNGHTNGNGNGHTNGHTGNGHAKRISAGYAAVSARPVTGTQVAIGDDPRAKEEIDALLRELSSRKASDLHLRCGEPPIIRVDGDVTRLSERSVLAADALTGMLTAIMPQMNRTEWLASGDTDFAYELAGVARFRANVLRDRKGPAAVFRLIPATVVSVEQMGLSAEVQQLCHLSKGLVLVTGPTGSGKSTTLCALIDLINRSRSDHIVTIEDPIEFVHENKKCLITQRQVGTHTQSFKQALRAALREDPDIVLVGELRDLETTAIAIETAETGHLVLGTLHTTTAPSTIDRIIDQFAADRQAQIRTMLSESLRGVISQTLCKKIGGGRVAAREVLLSTPALSNLIREGKTFQIASVMQTLKAKGMVPLNDALMALVESGQVEPAEAYSKAVEKSSLTAALKARGYDTGFAEIDQTPARPSAVGAARR